MLLVAMIGVGIAWASILSLPYAMLSGAVPPAKMGIYMGIFNFFIVIPQILAASVLGVLVRVLFHGESIYALATGGALMILAGLATLRVDDREARRDEDGIARPWLALCACAPRLPPRPARPRGLLRHGRAIRLRSRLLRAAPTASSTAIPRNDHRDQGGANQQLRSAAHRARTACPTTSATSAATSRASLDNAEYIRAMGFTAVWITPIVDNPDEAFTGGNRIGEGFFVDRGKTGYHGYWGVNFYRVDEHLESGGLRFADFTRRMRAEHGLKIVLDIVGNHGSPSYTMPVEQPKFGEIYDNDGRLRADHQNLRPEQLDPSNPLHRWFHREPDLARALQPRRHESRR